ncbi:MAG TPA: cupin domain-containing protein [Bacteroidales bacterium]|nr:cupin domain-containing protein [Bacteroidales bacterium]HRC89708.1 cupin domain-containing protein [Bacteroidales bacterium]
MDKTEQIFEKEKVFRFPEMIEYSAKSVVSKQVIKSQGGNITLFSFDAGEGLSEHTAPFDALVQVVDGTAEIVIGGNKHILREGDSIIMPASVPHSVYAPEKFKMALTMIR